MEETRNMDDAMRKKHETKHRRKNVQKSKTLFRLQKIDQRKI